MLTITVLLFLPPLLPLLLLQVRAGVPISCVSLPYSPLDTSAAALVELCKQHGIQVRQHVDIAMGGWGATAEGSSELLLLSAVLTAVLAAQQTQQQHC
jgi:diketogulonate reductase-like aldo/keto reductase